MRTSVYVFVFVLLFEFRFSICLNDISFLAYYRYVYYYPFISSYYIIVVILSPILFFLLSVPLYSSCILHLHLLSGSATDGPPGWLCMLPFLINFPCSYLS